MNTVLNICRQSEKHVIERLGKLHDVKGAGIYFAIPFIDTIKVINLPEVCISVPPLRATTLDNVMVDTSGSAYVSITDPVKALYGHANPFWAVETHVQSAMRVAIGRLNLDQCFHERGRINDIITENIRHATEAWGMRVLRYELTSVTPDPIILQSMDKQAAAERTKREVITIAEGAKRSTGDGYTGTRTHHTSTHTHTHALTHSFTRSLTHTLTISLSHTHTHTHTHMGAH